jgi:ribosome-associated protein
MSPLAGKAGIMDDDVKSRTRAKNEDRALQRLGEQLVGLSSGQLERIDIPNEIREAIGVARLTTAHGARNRQIKYIGGLLRQIELTTVRDALEDIRRGDYGKAMAFKQIETWREALIVGDSARIDEILTCCPDAERQRLTQLARNAKKEFEAQKGVTASRLLFRYLKEVSNL